jgi:hypothetical protein
VGPIRSEEPQAKWKRPGTISDPEARKLELLRIAIARARVSGQDPAMGSVQWTPEAKQRLKRVPFFVRPLLRKRAEALAKERGEREITTELLAQLRQMEHKGDDD